MACCTLGVLKRASTLMICRRATGSLPSMRAIKSSIDDSSAISAMTLNRPVLSLASWVYAAFSRSRTVNRLFCAAITSRMACLGMAGLVRASSSAFARIILARGQRPRDAGHRPSIGLGHGLEQQRQGLDVDEARQHLDIGHGLALFSRREGVDDGLDRARAERGQFFQSLLCQGAAWIAAGFNFGDEPVGAIVGE